MPAFNCNERAQGRLYRDQFLIMRFGGGLAAAACLPGLISDLPLTRDIFLIVHSAAMTAGLRAYYIHIRRTHIIARDLHVRIFRSERERNRSQNCDCPGACDERNGLTLMMELVSVRPIYATQMDRNTNKRAQFNES